VAVAVKVSQAIIATGAAVVLLAACGAPAQKASNTTSSAEKKGQWIDLPFSLGKAATGIAITKDGNVYVGDVGKVYERDRSGYQMTGSVPMEDLTHETGRVLLLEKGAAQQKVALDGVDPMYGIAVGVDGAIYTATREPKIKQFPKGATTSADLSFKLEKHAEGPSSLTVDDAGRVTVIDNYNDTALRLDRGAAAPTELDVLPFGGGEHSQLAVTNGGDVYCLGVSFSKTELRILPAGASEARGVVLTDVAMPLAMAVHGGDVYVLDDAGQGVPQEDYATENIRIVKFNRAAIDSVAAPANSVELPKAASSTVIPFTPGKKGSYHAMKVAPNGDIYLTDGAKVLKLTPA
jgi:hypothetical protein